MNGVGLQYKFFVLRYFFWLFFKFLRKIIVTRLLTIKFYTKKKFLLPLLFCFYYHTLIQAKCLIDLTCVDYPGHYDRFHIHYFLLSLVYNFRLEVVIPNFEWYLVKSITSLFSSANWLEREVWDMYGVAFEGHPDLRRLLTDYGFKGHPLRKNFPLTGYDEIFYDDAQKLIVTEPVELAQEFRRFKFNL